MVPNHLLARFHSLPPLISNILGGNGANSFLALLYAANALAWSGVKSAALFERSPNLLMFLAHSLSNFTLNFSFPERRYARMFASPRPVVPRTSAIIPSNAFLSAVAACSASRSINFVILDTITPALGAASSNSIFIAGVLSTVWAISSISCW